MADKQLGKRSDGDRVRFLTEVIRVMELGPARIAVTLDGKLKAVPIRTDWLVEELRLLIDLYKAGPVNTEGGMYDD